MQRKRKTSELQLWWLVNFLFIVCNILYYRYLKEDEERERLTGK